MIRKISIAAILFAAGCGSSGEAELVHGFELPEQQAGTTRFITPIVRGIQPGQDITYCQWLTAPEDRDLAVRSFRGKQSHFGHHIVLYSNSLTAPVGTSRECTSDDMLSVRFAGATPGEGNAFDFALPENVVFNIPKGTSLMANMHFINTGRDAVDGQGVIDIEVGDPKPEEIVAGMFTNVATAFTIAAGTAATADTSCTAKKKMNVFTFSNHMHEWGTSIYSEIIRKNGDREMVLEDRTWTADRVFDPLWSSWPATAPLVIEEGDVVHTHCEWMNDTQSELTFPREMCVGVAFYMPGGPEVNCVDGQWDAAE